MKKLTKFFALALSSVFAVSLLAGCGGRDNDETPDGDQSDNNELPALPTPDKTVTPFETEDVAFTLDGRTQASMSVSESLFGVFLEDINYAGYLLDDNLLPNGSFETFDTNKTSYWKGENATVTVENTAGVLKNETYYGAKGVNANYAALSVTAGGGGLTSTGHQYLPIAIEKDVEYTFSAFIKSSAAANLTVSLQDADSSYAEKTLALKGNGQWVKYVTTLKPSATKSENITFKMSFDTAGTYYLDGIQLETANATDGIKQYAYDAIKELGPKFIRFPGGCIIEGDGGNGGGNTQEVYDWKNSIGAVQTGDNAGDDGVPAFTYTLVKDGEESTKTTQGEWITRRQNGDLWGYDMEYGIGFLEFFELCENLNASAVPVLNCGYSCMGGGATNPTALNGRHNKKVEDYIREAVDLIEFAKGDTTTKWGKIREELGHPAPFEMDYLGIGNEQYGVYYTEYYEKFLQSDKFKEALAQYNVQPIVGNGMFITNCQNTTSDQNATKGTAQEAAEKAVQAGVVGKISDYGVHDQHYYVNWSQLLDNYKMYDKYANPTFAADTYYNVFVGEYSANTEIDDYPEHQNQLITALAEAAMMTSYERNGNVIKLAAYAPMFGIANRSANPVIGGEEDVNHGGANQWAVDMMYYTNTTIVKTANYYVQQLFMQNQGVSYLYNSKEKWTSASTFIHTGGKTFNKLYYVPSVAANGDLLFKVVNVSGEAVKMNINITNATSRGFAYVTELQNDNYKALNTEKNQAVAPVSSSIGWEGQSLGYEFKPYSLTVLRIPTQA